MVCAVSVEKDHFLRTFQAVHAEQAIWHVPTVHIWAFIQFPSRYIKNVNGDWNSVRIIWNKLDQPETRTKQVQTLDIRGKFQTSCVQCPSYGNSNRWQRHWTKGGIFCWGYMLSVWFGLFTRSCLRKCGKKMNVACDNLSPLSWQASLIMQLDFLNERQP